MQEADFLHALEVGGRFQRLGHQDVLHEEEAGTPVVDDVLDLVGFLA